MAPRIAVSGDQPQTALAETIPAYKEPDAPSGRNGRIWSNIWLNIYPHLVHLRSYGLSRDGLSVAKSQ